MNHEFERIAMEFLNQSLLPVPRQNTIQRECLWNQRHPRIGKLGRANTAIQNVTMLRYVENRQMEFLRTTGVASTY
jgi:hypothetical protein